LKIRLRIDYHDRCIISTLPTLHMNFKKNTFQSFFHMQPPSLKFQFCELCHESTELEFLWQLEHLYWHCLFICSYCLPLNIHVSNNYSSKKGKFLGGGDLENPNDWWKQYMNQQKVNCTWNITLSCSAMWVQEAVQYKKSSNRALCSDIRFENTGNLNTSHRS
jgi:hypothetical protein